MTLNYNDSRVKTKTRVWDRAEIDSDYNNYNGNNNDNIKIDANNNDSNSINIIKYKENNYNIYISKDDKNCDEKDIL